MAVISGLQAGSWPELHSHWWRWVLFVFILGPVLAGSVYIVVSQIRRLLRYLAKKNGPSDALIEAIANHLQQFSASRSQLSSRTTLEKQREWVKPTSLGVYLGPFELPPTEHQAKLFFDNDMVILDPLQPKISATLKDVCGNPGTPRHIAGRLDLTILLDNPSHTRSLEAFLISSVDKIMSIVSVHFQSLDGVSNGFNGILLAGWEIFPIPVLNQLSAVLTGNDLEVYLETGAPNFLEHSNVLAAESIAGLVIRNGLMHPNGDRRDCFDLESLRTTVKSFVSQACLRNFSVLAWETLDDDAVPSIAVLKRTYTWCSFYSVVPWIGSNGALFDTSKKVLNSEPLSAFDWLKQLHVMELQDLWRNKRTAEYSNQSHSAYKQVGSLLPGLEAAQSPTCCAHDNSIGTSFSATASFEDHDWFLLKEAALGDPICLSPDGMSYDGIGCFPLGVDVTIDDFQEICSSQRNLRKLNLLDSVPTTTLQSYGTTFRQFMTDVTSAAVSRQSRLLCGQDDILELSELLSQASDDCTEGIRVFVGLHSGLQKTSDKQFWAVHNVHASLTDIYLSRNAQDVMGTILHTFLSSRGFSRRQCFTAEFIFSGWNNTLIKPHDIPPRTVQDLTQLSPEECITLLQRVTLSSETNGDLFLAGVKSALAEQLIDQPSMQQLKELNTIAYLGGSIDVEDLVATRLRWQCQRNQPHPNLAAAVALFSEVEAAMFRVLKQRKRDELQIMTDALNYFLSLPATADPAGDIFALAIFCTMRKLAIEEVYIEVTDRNPLWNDQADQAAAFAELFALGARCESYFDMTPSQFGELLSKKYRDHYTKVDHQPPVFNESKIGLTSAYAEAQIDVNPDDKASEMPAYQRFTFLSVFAIPALIDTLMLSMTGHGIYLSSYMSKKEQHGATVALMLSLLLSGAIGTWITCGGTYYLASMAFSAMNYFVLTRLLGGFAFTLIVGLIGFVAFTCLSGIEAGVVFFLYLMALTTYLCLLAALANYQFTGSAFQSGRAIIVTCIPVLFISPLTTIFVPNHDIDIYLTVLYLFVSLLILGLRRTGSRWTTWYQNIFLLDDSTMKGWYLDTISSSAKDDLLEMSEPAILKLARQALFHNVALERRKWFFSSRTNDQLVAKLVKTYEATDFLMDWYSRYSNVAKPMHFSSSWNVQTKVALDSLQKSQLGIRFHNGFIHWRQAGDEIGCTILYFIIALLDKWVLLLSGGALTGYLTSSISLRKPVGFGLAYYLIGAVLLDFNAHKLHELAAQGKEEIVPSDDDISGAVMTKAHARKSLYWRTLWRYLALHIWGLAVTTTLLWVFSSEEQATLIFLSYVGAYTGLLWYQYTKVFSGPRALKPLLIGVSVGLPLGFVLHYRLPNFVYSEIIALGVATWTVAILSLWAGKIVGTPVERPLETLEGSFHAYSAPGTDQNWSQPELQSLHDKLTGLEDGERFPIDPDSDFGQNVKTILRKWRYTKLPELAARAFPDAEKLLELSEKLFQEGLVTVELVSVDHLIKYDRAMRAVSSEINDRIRVFVGCETKGIYQNQDPLPWFYQDVGELLIQVVAERFLGYSVCDAVLAQNLWANTSVWCESANSSILERQLRIRAKAGDASKLIAHLRKQLLRDLCLGFECDIEWQSLPADIREYLVTRCLGHSAPPSDDQIQFFRSKLNMSSGLKFDTFLARSNYAAFTGALSLSRAGSWLSGDQSRKSHSYQNVVGSISVLNLFARTSPVAPPSLSDKLRKHCGFIYHQIGIGCKFFSVAFVADPEYQREVKCTFSYGPHVTQSLSRIIFMSIWMWSKAFQQLFLPLFLFHRRDRVVTLWENIQGMEVSFKRKRVTIRTLDGIYTAFVHPADEGTFKLLQYRGDHHSEPENKDNLCSINEYSKDMALLRRAELKNGSTINEYVYEYRTPDPGRKRLSKTDILTSPISRKGISGQNNLQAVNYNSKGQIDSGSWIKDGNLIRFRYHYQKTAKFQDALLRAEFVLPHMSCTVSWCAAPRRHPEKLDSWIPHSQVTEATFVIGADVWENKYLYDHKFHPTILTTLNGRLVDTPPLVLYDYLDVLTKPEHVSFLDDNPLLSFNSVNSNAITRWLGLYTRKYPFSTSQARSRLWKAWKHDPGFDGIIVRWLDERLLRRDPVLRPYWRKRDSGFLDAAEAYLDQNRDAVMASVDLDNTISSWTPLAMKINDLYSFGQGGDACSRTRSNDTEDDEAALHVIAIDTGTWPNEGGGVSACRSDVINNLRTIKWHMVAEAANDFGLPKRQIERNVHSLKVIPLWGLDLMTPTHGLFANRLDSEVDHTTTHATLLDIEHTFVPILAAIISGARALDFTISDIKQVTRALVNLNAYFKDSRHWSAVWRSDIVKNAWRRLWLAKLTSNALPPSEWLKTELPTLGQLDQGLELWSRYLFIFSIPIPEKMPAVFQASHHSVSASYGVVCKIKRGCILQIWDHAISWRETNLYLSSALCTLSPFVRNSLLGLMKVTSVLTLHYADTILPCADFFNPNWEVEIGTCQGKIENRSKFRRKIDPVVNGITHMERFAPVQELETKNPTVTMLSHVWYAKDIKTALLAADIIINKWGFKAYRLDIYGAIDKSPAYTTNCQEIIATKSLRTNVSLKGEADPIAVLKKTWVFLNSSISEGLPLALGEAALTGAPIVCTDVGASLRVLTNPEDGSCFSEVVAPNDAFAMARAQIKILALLEEWSEYADDTACSEMTRDSSFPVNPTPEDVARITQRMYEQFDARGALGMKSRAIVEKSFSGDRYLREHEQMLWVGKARQDMARWTSSRPTTLIPAPRPVQLANITSQPVQPAPEVVSQVEDSLPSLAYGTSIRPSLATDFTFGQSVTFQIAEQEWIKTPQRAVVKVVEVGSRRESGGSTPEPDGTMV